MEKSNPILLSEYLFKRFASDEKKITGIIWVFLLQFPIAFYFFKILQFLFILFYFIWQNIYVHFVRYSVLFWFMYKPGNVEFRVIQTPITLNFPIPNGKLNVGCYFPESTLKFILLPLLEGM